MDVLRPPVVWIKGRCYRKLPFERSTNSESTAGPYQEQEDMMYEDEVCDGLVEETSKGFRATLSDIPSALYKFIIGKGGKAKKKIEEDTDTRISIPSQGQTGDIVITGPHKAGVLSARSRVVVIAESSRQKFPFTHFLSFPLYFDDLAVKAQEFKETVLQQFGQSRGIDISIFQKPSKLHLTIGMLVLLNEDEVNKAATFLSTCYKDLIRESLANQPVSVQLQGVEIMNDDPSSVNVLYAKIIEVDGTQRLQHLADSLVECFVEQGLMRREYDHVKLHATLMNSKLHSDLEETQFQDGGKKREGFQPNLRGKYNFDAKDILEKFQDFDFGEFHLHEIHISERGSYDAQGHYKCAASVPLP